MDTDWIDTLFPTDDPEAFSEALERSILGDFGPGSVRATLDAIVEHAQQIGSFRGRLSMTCEDFLFSSWFAPDANIPRERKVLIGLFLLIRRIPLETVADNLREWFDRYARTFEDEEGGVDFGGAALGALMAIEGERSPEVQAWWERYAGSDPWSAKIRNLELYTIRT